MLRLETLGGLALNSEHGQRPQRRRRLAVLARLATADDRGVSRDELLAMFWPESDGDAARHSLDQLLYEARRAIGKSPAIGTTTLRLNPDVITCDVADWAAALANSDFERAVALYRGPFLQGFNLQNAHGFEPWVESVRAEFALQYRRALASVAAEASRDGRFSDAVEWWRRLVTEDRFGSRAALGLMRAMVDAGDRAGALDFARLHSQVVWTELEAPPDPAIATYAEELRRTPLGARPTPSASSVTPTTPSPDDGPTQSSSAPIIAPLLAPAPQRRLVKAPLLTGAAGLVLGAFLYGVSAFGRERGTTDARASGQHDVAGPRRPPSAQSGGTKNLAAYDLYQHGRDPLHQRSDSGIMHAIADLEQAVALDSNYAQAYAALARAYATASAFRVSVTPAARHNLHSRAVAAASRAITLDNSLADAHAELGYLLSLGYDPSAAIAELQRSIALDSTVSSVHEVLVKTYEWADRPNDALAAAQRAVDTDSMSVSAAAELGDALYFARRYDEAFSQLKKVAAVRPPLRRAAGFLAEVYMVRQQWKEAIDVLQPAASTDEGYRGLLGYALARSGRRQEAMALLDQMLATKTAPAFSIAEVNIGLQQYDSAFVWLERSLDDYSLRPTIMGPLFDDLHARPEFKHWRCTPPCLRQVRN